MESLKAKGLELFAAYGNTGTDARAYAAAGIPKVSFKYFRIREHPKNGRGMVPCHERL